jgi:hypothetical protein
MPTASKPRGMATSKGEVTPPLGQTGTDSNEVVIFRNGLVLLAQMGSVVMDLGGEVMVTIVMGGVVTGGCCGPIHQGVSRHSRDGP